jgi:hypothetical protein
MQPKAPVLFGIITLTAVVLLAPPRTAFAQDWTSAAKVHPLPQAIRIEHKETLEQLTALAQKPGPVGPAASQALVLLQRHMAREQEFILPPLTLLPELADGKVTADMAWALPMTERVRAEREELFQEHVQITDALNGLVGAAEQANDPDAKEFAESAAADSLTDLEIFEPALIMIGNALRAQLPAAH